jgi:hypothetical protein
MSRKAAPNEDELLQRRIQHAQWLSGMLQDPQSVASLTVAAYAGEVVCVSSLFDTPQLLSPEHGQPSASTKFHQLPVCVEKGIFATNRVCVGACARGLGAWANAACACPLAV